MNRIKKGDTVIVIAGKCKGQTGEVASVSGFSVVVKGINLVKKHVKPNPQLNEKGGIITKEAALNISNVAMYNSVSKTADKVGFKFLEKDGVSHKVRYFKSNNELIDLI